PAPACQFAGDGHVGDGGAFAAFEVADPAVVQAPVALITADPGGCGCQVPPGPHPGPDPVGRAVVPGCLDEQSAGMGIAGLGDRALGPGGSGGVLTGDQPEVGA